MSASEKEPPTAIPVLASTNEMAFSWPLVPLDRGVHVVPPSVVRRMVPKSPTATLVFPSRIATARSPFPCGSGFCQNQPDCPKDVVGATATPTHRRSVGEMTFMLFGPSNLLRWRALHRRSDTGPERATYSGARSLSRGKHPLCQIQCRFRGKLFDKRNSPAGW